MSSIWYMNVEDRVFTLIKSFTYSKLKKLYPQILFTAINQLPTDTTYSHVVYIHELQGVECGRTLENTEVNAYISTFEVIVSVTEENKDNNLGKKQEVKEITGYIIDAFKRLNFDCISMPILEITSGAYTSPMRFRRKIGANDADILGN